jgi:hypothetical protein
MERELIRVFCEGRRSERHERTRMEAIPYRMIWRCPNVGCGEMITQEHAHRSVPKQYQAMMDNWLGGVLADWADIGAIDIIFVGLYEVQIEYPRRNQV